MTTITTNMSKTVLHLDKGEKATIVYSDGAHRHQIRRCVWIAREDGSTWAMFCGQWNRVYERLWFYVDGICANNEYDPDGFAK